MSNQDCLPVIKTNDVKKGATVILNDGTEATVMDNRRGNLRQLKVPQIFRPGEFDYGDMYAHDWEFAIQGGVKFRVDHTESQGKVKDFIKELYGE